MVVVECLKCHRFASSGHNLCSHCGATLPNIGDTKDLAKPYKTTKKSSNLAPMILGAVVHLILKDWSKWGKEKE